MVKVGFTALVTAGVCFAFGAASGVAVTQTHFYTVSPGSYVHFAGLDLSCAVFPKDLTKGTTDPGPGMYCSRYSSKHSRAVVFTLYHIRVTDESGNNTMFVAGRSP
jgi:hypothetical protein